MNVNIVADPRNRILKPSAAVKGFFGQKGAAPDPAAFTYTDMVRHRLKAGFLEPRNFSAQESDQLPHLPSSFQLRFGKLLAVNRALSDNSG